MTITYTWTVDQLFILPQVDKYTDVVVQAIATLTGTNGTQGSAVGGIQVQFSMPQGDNFTPYDELTQDQVIGWIVDTLGPSGVAQYETIIQQEIDVPPPVPQPAPLPW